MLHLERVKFTEDVLFGIIAPFLDFPVHFFGAFPKEHMVGLKKAPPIMGRASGSCKGYRFTFCLGQLVQAVLLLEGVQQ